MYSESFPLELLGRHTLATVIVSTGICTGDLIEVGVKKQYHLHGEKIQGDSFARTKATQHSQINLDLGWIVEHLLSWATVHNFGDAALNWSPLYLSTSPRGTYVVFTMGALNPETKNWGMCMMAKPRLFSEPSLLSTEIKFGTVRRTVYVLPDIHPHEFSYDTSDEGFVADTLLKDISDSIPTLPRTASRISRYAPSNTVPTRQLCKFTCWPDVRVNLRRKVGGRFPRTTNYQIINDWPGIFQEEPAKLESQLWLNI